MKKKIAIFVMLLCMTAILLPGVARATTYNNSIPSGATLLYWSVVNSGGHASATFIFSGNSGVSLPIPVPFNSSWHLLDDTRPILLAHQAGDDNYLGGPNGLLGSNVKFSDNVLAAMKIQNFNPVQVGGANIPPSSTTLTSAEIAWLKQPGVGYASDLAKLTTSNPASSQASSSPAPQTQTQIQSTPSQNTTSTSSSTAAKPQQSTSSTTTPSVTSNPGKAIKTPSGTMTPAMVASDQQAVSKKPPNLNPTNIPIKIPAKPVKKAASPLSNKWVWMGIGVVIVVLVGIGGRIIYLRRRTA